MNTSNITKSALALALGLCATGAWATVAVTNAFENFNSYADGTKISGLNASQDITWYAGADAAEYSYVNGSTHKLVVDTGDSVITGALDNAAAFNNKIADHNAKFSAKVAFTPATENPTIDTTGLKFALFAKADGGATNLFVYANGGAASTGIAINDTNEKLVEVVFTANNKFTVAVDGGSASSEFTFFSGTGVSQVEFQGNGEVDDVGFSYELATVSVTVTGDTANLTAAWEVDGESVGSAPATLTEGQTYSVTFSAASGYAIKDGETTTFNGTAATTAISIAAPLVEELPSYAEGQTDAVAGHTLTADEADYLNELVTEKGASAVEMALASIDEDDFVAATLLNQDITDNDFDGANSYSFDITKISKSGSTVTVTVKLVRNANVDVLGAIQGTAKLYTCDTPNGTYTEAGVAAISFPDTTTGEQTGTATFTGVNKFFKVVIE